MHVPCLAASCSKHWHDPGNLAGLRQPGQAGDRGRGAEGGGVVRYLRPYGVQSRFGCCNSLSCWPSSGLEGPNSPISSGNRLTYLHLYSTSLHVTSILCTESFLGSLLLFSWAPPPPPPHFPPLTTRLHHQCLSSGSTFTCQCAMPGNTSLPMTATVTMHAEYITLYNAQA